MEVDQCRQVNHLANRRIVQRLNLRRNRVGIHLISRVLNRAVSQVIVQLCSLQVTRVNSHQINLAVSPLVDQVCSLPVSRLHSL